MEKIRVLNGSEERIKGRFAGKDYILPPKGSLDLSPDAAAHIFGFGEEDKTNALSHLGWLLPTTRYEDALAKLDQLTFVEGRLEFDEPEESSVPKRTRAARPHGNAGGEAEEE